MAGGLASWLPCYFYCERLRGPAQSTAEPCLPKRSFIKSRRSLNAAAGRAAELCAAPRHARIHLHQARRRMKRPMCVAAMTVSHDGTSLAAADPSAACAPDSDELHSIWQPPAGGELPLRVTAIPPPPSGFCLVFRALRWWFPHCASPATGRCVRAATRSAEGRASLESSIRRGIMRHMKSAHCTVHGSRTCIT